MKTENDIIAEYVREKCPFVLESSDFAMYRLSKRLGELGAAVGKAAAEVCMRFKRGHDHEKENGTNADCIICDESADGSGSKNDIQIRDEEDGDQGESERKEQEADDRKDEHEDDAD